MGLVGQAHAAYHADPEAPTAGVRRMLRPGVAVDVGGQGGCILPGHVDSDSGHTRFEP